MAFNVVTINLNNAGGLRLTLHSLRVLFEAENHFHVVFVDGRSSDGSLELLADFCSIYPGAASLVVGDDSSIYDAMNIGLNNCKPGFVTFLNSGDQLWISGPLSRITRSCRFASYRSSDAARRPYFYSFIGMPSSHQSIVFPVTEARYDLSFPIASDYHYFLTYLFQGVSFPYVADVFSLVESGGVSEKMYVARRLESSRIRSLFFGSIMSRLVDLLIACRSS